jgi:hypothetical protein
MTAGHARPDRRTRELVARIEAFMEKLSDLFGFHARAPDYGLLKEINARKYSGGASDWQAGIRTPMELDSGSGLFFC